MGTLKAKYRNRLIDSINKICRILIIAGMLLVFAGSLIARENDKYPRHNSLLFFTHDNDAFKLTNDTEKYYSFGLFFGYQKLISNESAIHKILPFSSRKKSRHCEAFG